MIVADHIHKTLGDPPTPILKDISLQIRDREFIAITGRSGSGKSTLLYVLSSLDEVSQGRIQIDSHDLAALTGDALSAFRNRQMGFVFQFHYLLSELTALENVLMPARKAGERVERRDYAMSLLDQFGLAAKADRFPRQMSGGEMQRLAIARALVMQPKYIFADEPTGSLDSVNGNQVMRILRESNKHFGTTVLLVTHDPEFAAQADRRIHLVDGRIADA
jgi:lipoprotein-releasing system ATP-binding protein